MWFGLTGEKFSTLFVTDVSLQIGSMKRFVVTSSTMVQQSSRQRRWRPVATAIWWGAAVCCASTSVSAWQAHSLTTPSSLLVTRGRQSQRPSSSSSVVVLHALDAITVECLSDDHESVASALKGSVQRWLDAEWMPQIVHEQMAQSCQQSYLRCRQNGQTEVMTIMIAVAEDLEKDWRQYDADAFVNAWDIGNYVSDYLTAQAGVEGCECSARIY